jgi:murein DD-endopeptidase MepM/ murein hydrolase activator NlpD
MRARFALLALVLTVSGCAAPAIGSVTPTVPAAATTTNVPATVTAAATGTASPVPATPTSATTVTPSGPTPADMTCAEDEAVCIVAGHFVFRRPLDESANLAVDPTYTYGATQDGKREPHHGIDFPNKQGTPVWAAGDGRVVVAGNDKLELYGWVTNFYGNLVVIAHTLPGFNEPVFTLYGHLFEVDVRVGQMVRAGDRIGEVGSTGIAIGSHLHLEVRVGQDDYRSTRNPQLWMEPLPGTGALAGRVLDARGNLTRSSITIERFAADAVAPLYPLETYARETLNGDDVWHENFAAGDLPAGDYRLSLIYNGVLYAQRLQIQPDRLTLVTFQVK